MTGNQQSELRAECLELVLTAILLELNLKRKSANALLVTD